VALKRNQVRFIKEVDLSELRTTDSPDEFLSHAGFQKLTQQLYKEDPEEAPEGDFSYLLEELRVHALTREKADALEADLEQKLKDLKTLKKTSEDSMWLKEIGQFRKAYIKEYDLDRTPSAPPVVSPQDWAEAQEMFEPHRMRRLKPELMVVTATPLQLQKKSRKQLAIILESGGLSTSGTQNDCIQRLLKNMKVGTVSKLNKADIRMHLDARGLSIEGNRKELVARLQEYESMKEAKAKSKKSTKRTRSTKTTKPISGKKSANAR